MMQPISQTASILARLPSPAALRQLQEDQLSSLADELRRYLIHSLNQSGGHFGASLGAVELTLALHYVFNTPNDTLIWDIGHQALAHKVLTGRYEQLTTLRQKGGIAPFPSRAESHYDAFGTGHAGTAISAAAGYALAAKLNQRTTHSIAIVGDAAMATGLSFEALNHVGTAGLNVLVILNDNAMSISPSVGALSHYLKQTTDKKIPLGTLFKDLGFTYQGPIDGHNLTTLIPTLRTLSEQSGPRLLHVTTIKGKGYPPAENNPVKYHAVSPQFLAKTTFTSLSAPTKPTTLSYTQVFSDWICAMAAQDKQLIAITPAMREGSGLTAFAKTYPDRYIDVGIAEGHSLTLAAGLACQGYKPVVAIYSTFLQRAYDQLIHDIALQQLPVLLAIDRAGLVGYDGPTHHGNFDLSYLRCIPNLVIMAPSNEHECQQMLTTGFKHPGPAAVRYPRGQGTGTKLTNDPWRALPIGQARVRRQGTHIALLAFGTLVQPALMAGEALNATVVDMRFIKPLDQVLIQNLVKEHTWFVTLEENTQLGGAGSGVNEIVAQLGLSVKIINLGLPDHFIDHGQKDDLLADNQLDSHGIIDRIRQRIGTEVNSNYASSHAKPEY